MEVGAVKSEAVRPPPREVEQKEDRKVQKKEIAEKDEIKAKRFNEEGQEKRDIAVA